MIILLTGTPGVGKSTILKKFIALYQESSVWILTSRIPNPSGDGGLGFIATDSLGRTQLVSHKTDVESDIIVGRNHVDVKAVEKMFVPILQKAIDHSEALSIIDEIGPIQLAAPAFGELLPQLFTEQVDVVAIIHAQEERLTEYREHPKAILLEATLENRDILPDALLAMAQNRQAFNALTNAQQSTVKKLLQNYVSEAKLTQIKKLMKHAISYAVENKLKPLDSEHWAVEGQHGSYTVEKTNQGFTCTCDLFNGRNQYEGQAGECSHIQVVKIYN